MRNLRSGRIREFLKRYLTEKQNGYLQCGREVVARRELSVICSVIIAKFNCLRKISILLNRKNLIPQIPQNRQFAKLSYHKISMDSLVKFISPLYVQYTPQSVIINHFNQCSYSGSLFIKNKSFK